MIYFNFLTLIYIMLKKNIRRPLRLFTKEKKPYIIYKSKKYYIKSTEIKDILKLISKLHKKTIKKVQDDITPKKNIKKYLNESIKLTGGPSSSTSTNIGKEIEKETFMINKLNEKLEEIKDKDKKLNDKIKAIEDKENNIKAIQNDDKDVDKLIVYDNNDKIYKLETNFGPIKGVSIDDVKKNLNKNLLLIYNKYHNDVEDLQKEKKIVEGQMNNIIEEKKNIELQVDDLQKKEKILKGKIYTTKFYSNIKKSIDQKRFQKLEDEKKKIEQDKLNFESLSKKQQEDLLEKEQKIKEKEQELINKQVDIDRKQRYINYDKMSIDELNIISRNLFNTDRDSKVQFNNLYNNFYNLQEDNKYPKEKKLEKELLINFILDKQDQNAANQQIQVQEQEQEQGNGKSNNNDFGLWNYQIDKIMKPFKLFIKTITMDELDNMIKYIFDNKILKGSFILNVGNHWTAIYYDFENEYVLEYYDPFGDPPKSKIINLFKDLILKLNIDVFVKFKINRIQQQDVRTSNCGWFSMYFLIMRYNNYTFKYITKFKNIKQEEKNIEDLKNKYDQFGFI